MWSLQGVYRVFSPWKTPTSKRKLCILFGVERGYRKKRTTMHRYRFLIIRQEIIDNRVLVLKRNKVMGGGGEKKNNRLKFTVCVLFYCLRSRFALKDIAALMRAPADNAKKVVNYLIIAVVVKRRVTVMVAYSRVYCNIVVACRLGILP